MAELWPAIFGIGGRAPEERSLRSGNPKKLQEGMESVSFSSSLIDLQAGRQYNRIVSGKSRIRQ